ncbi:MAG: four helix bundle protein [Terracidiphilus sp.]|nr:four helix bundle protein [Terracidiphilus sp.]
MAQAFQDLTVWQRAMEMTVCIYGLTRTFPKDEMYGLTSQLRRASVSVASNIAEGRGRMTDGEFRQFLGMAQGSTYEVQTQLLVARRLKTGDEATLNEAEALCIETSKMLGAFIQSLGARG